MEIFCIVRQFECSSPNLLHFIYNLLRDKSDHNVSILKEDLQSHIMAVLPPSKVYFYTSWSVPVYGFQRTAGNNV